MAVKAKATTKAKSTKVKDEEVKIEKALIAKEKENKELIAKTEQMEQQNKELNDKMVQLEQMMKNLANMQMQTQAPVQAQTIKIEQAESVEIGTSFIGKVMIEDKNDNEILPIEEFGEKFTLTTDEVTDLLSIRNKGLFKDGLLHFIDKANYKRFSVKCDTIIDDDYISKLYAMEEQDMLSELNRVTQRKEKIRIMYSIYWRLVYNIYTQKEGFNQRVKEKTIEEFFGEKLSNSTNILKIQSM